MFNDAIASYYGYSRVADLSWDRLIELHQFCGREQTVRSAATSFKNWRRQVFERDSLEVSASNQVSRDYYDLLNAQRMAVRASAFPVAKPPFRRLVTGP